MSNEFAINCKTGRLLKKSTALYRKLKKLNLVKEIENEEPKAVEVKAVEVNVEPVEYDPKRLQEKLADISTDLIKDNLKQIVKAHKLSDNEMDDMLRRLLYKKLCIEQPKPKEEKKKKKKSKFKIIESSSSDSESD